MELTALKVKIRLRSVFNKRTGKWAMEADHPNFNLLPVVQAAKLDWSHYVDKHGLGWCYDKISGHKDDSVDSPMGEQLGCLAIPEQFAIEAVIQFPTLCTRITETEFETFYNERAMIKMPENRIEDTIISGLQGELDLMEKTGAVPRDINELKTQIRRALDPNNSEPGVTKNKRKRWATHKADKKVTMKDLI